MTENPLLRNYHKIEKYITLPSRGHYYTDEVEVNEFDQIPIIPMSAREEIMLRNPDALLNGRAISSVIKACCPTVAHPEKLLINDIKAILMALHMVSHGDDIERGVTCPKCKTSHIFAVSCNTKLAEMTKLESEYPIEINGDMIYVRPYTWKEAVLKSNEDLVLHNVQKQVDEMVKASSEEAERLMDELFEKVYNSHIEAITYSIEKVVITDGVPQVVTDREMIRELVKVLNTDNIKKLNEVIERVNSVGVSDTMTVVCPDCGHEWIENGMEYNPSHFFG